jgi:hypothetical protein
MYHEQILEFLALIDSEVRVNLEQKISNHDPKSLQKVELADKALIRWEGDLNNAQLFVSQTVREILQLHSRPFKQFITLYEKLGDVAFDHSFNFETACIYRFQEMFYTGIRPDAKFARWFHGSELGRVENFTVVKEIQNIPKLTSNGENVLRSMHQATVSPELWPEPLSLMEKSSPHAIFRPGAMSSSSDFIITSSCLYNDADCLVTVGLAVKCFSATAMNSTQIKEELAIFNAMFPSRTKTNGSVNRLNTLIVCCSSATPRGKPVPATCLRKLDIPSEFDRLDEALYLDLSTREKRADFFELSDPTASRLLDNLEHMIAKVAKVGDTSNKSL